MRRLVVALRVLVAVLAASSTAAVEVVDRVVAAVDETPILLSDLERALALGVVERRPGEGDATLRRRALDRLVDQRLRLREAERFGAPAVAPAAVDAQVAAIAERLGGDAALDRLLVELGLDRAELAFLVEQQLAVLAYIEARVAPRVFVPADEVTAYYHDVLTPEMAQRGAPLPPLAEVREPIRRLLRERRLDREIAEWTDELRRAARVEVLLDDAPATAPLPPVVEVLPPPPPPP